MNRFIIPLAALTALSACAAGASRSSSERVSDGAHTDTMSVVAATELAFARMAREKGTWTAFRHFAAVDAVMPAPQFRNVHEILKDRPDPPEAIVWEPDTVWLSCSGEYALSTGPATYPGGSKGRFATIWQRQLNGEYRWVLDQGFELESDYSKPEKLMGSIAECTGVGSTLPAGTAGLDYARGRSVDGSFIWETTLAPDCARTFVVFVRWDGELQEVFRREAAAPPPPDGQPAQRCDA